MKDVSEPTKMFQTQSMQLEAKGTNQPSLIEVSSIGFSSYDAQKSAQEKNNSCDANVVNILDLCVIDSTHSCQIIFYSK